MSRLFRTSGWLIKETDCFQIKHHPPGVISVRDITILVKDYESFYFRSHYLKSHIYLLTLFLDQDEFFRILEQFLNCFFQDF